MKKLNQLRAANDQQLKKIHGTDYSYTESVIIYLRSKLSKDPYAIEEAISDLLATLIDAQQSGHRVAIFFSDDPQKAADHILKELPRVPVWYLLNQYWPVLMFLFAASIFPTISQKSQLSLVSVGGPILFAVAFVNIPFARGLSFNKLSRKTVYSAMLGFAMVIIALLILSYLVAGRTPFSVSRSTLLLFCVSFLVLNLIGALGFRKIAYLFLAWACVWLLAFIGMLLTTSALTVGIAITGVLVATLLLFYHPEPKSQLPV
ncbi:hypothetical protein FD51_GL000753 [Lacticaseibacillus zeae DSM 20178 = KCTC 3804]|uniref:DUF1129 family protein n=2 Tax=Lacticaseibacillus zeae TaxID=57037 RepID=A0A5R8LRU3_LACZE|nr:MULTISPECIES: hypothetical protein [Lacticaseibacillus]KRK11964.1 hypothetical protein FD51_GL000753 [Lacticaseibacillus zeae DSM 20178 = KCTC 3804]MDE3283331.1 hypothetical protein [Lacticaseibacillus casei]OLS11583.1 hypothetical protein AUQ39_00135 [Lacticaseibacillus casei]QVI31493.1 hypothetical protein KG087_11305 [Lacticaseibacillus zeae]TLF39947.1 hypothetical protein FEI14_11460 [Lacticaseibacillus zeae]